MMHGHLNVEFCNTFRLGPIDCRWREDYFSVKSRDQITHWRRVYCQNGIDSYTAAVNLISLFL